MDNGSGSVPDRTALFASVTPLDCSPLDSALSSPLRSGDIVVTDAVPVPSSKDECKAGGWRNFGATFKNEGQCVAFVQRGPKS